MAEYYLDVDSWDHETSFTLDWVNGSNTITVSGDVTSEIPSGSYIRSTDDTNGGTWYKATTSYDPDTDQTTITLNVSFKEDTHTATAYVNNHSGAPFTLTGTVTFTNGSTSVTGSGTLFLSELKPGNYIRPQGKDTFYKIDSIIDDLNITLTSAATEDYSGTAEGLKPFCHLAQYTIDTVRIAGDILYVQNGQTLRTAFLVDIDEDGTYDSPIKIVGSDWQGLGNSSRPLIDFLGIGIYLNKSYDDHWVTGNIDFTNSSSYCVKFVGARGSKLRNSKIFGSVHGALFEYTTTEIENVEFDSISSRAIDVTYVFLIGKNVKITNSGYGLYVRIATDVKFDNISFSANSVDVNLSSDSYGSARVYLKGQEPSAYTFNSNVDNISQCICVEDGSGPGTHKSLYPYAVVEKDTSVTFTSGSSPSIKYTSTGPQLTRLAEWELDGLVGGTAYTVSVLVKSTSLDAFPSADQLYVEVEYYDEAAPSTHKATVRSSEVITANDTETTLSVSFTPAQDGKIVIRIYAGFDISANESVAGAGAIYVDNAFTIS